MLEYRIAARRSDVGTSLASTTIAKVRMDTGLAGSPDAFNPTELLLAAIAACMIKGIERVTPMLNFKLDGVEVSLHAVRQDAPQRIISVDYESIPTRATNGWNCSTRMSAIWHDREHDPGGSPS